jgi:CspA family cold shock protein
MRIRYRSGLVAEVRCDRGHPRRRSNKVRIGTVKWFNESKGYGFIIAEDSEEDVFVHYSQIVMDGFKTLAEGQSVQFQLVQTPKGLQAHNVTMS